MSEKTYIDGLFIKRGKGEYETLKISIKAETFIEQIKGLVNDKGYVNIEIKPRKEVDKNGNSHYAELDTWQPDKAKTTADVTKEALKQEVSAESEDNDLPF